MANTFAAVSREKKRAPASGAFEARPLDLTPSGIGGIRELMRTVWPKSRHLTAEYLAWAYVGNPEGLAVGFGAYAGDLLVGHYVALPVSAEIEGVREKGFLSVNSAVHPQYRGRNIFKILARRTFEAALTAGRRFVVGIANAQSTLLFERLLKFQLVGPLEARIGTGPVRRRASGALPCFRRLWDEEVLKWRLSRPENPYRLARRGRKGTVYAPTGIGGIYAEMGEFDGERIPALVQALRSFNPLKLWIGLDPERSAPGYIPVPRRLKPSPLNMIFKDLSGAGRSLDIRRVRFDAIDFDAY